MITCGNPAASSGDVDMKKTVLCALAVLAAAVSTSAVAKDLKQDRKAPAVSTTQMSDSEMDRVTAGDPGNVGHGYGRAPGPGWEVNLGNGPKGQAVGHTK